MATKATIGTEGNDQETFIVKVTVSTTPSYTSSISPPSSSTTPAPAPPNDLISQLSAQLSQSNQKVILDPSEVVAFQLVGGRGLPGYSQLSSSPSTSTSTSTWGNEATNWNTVGGGTKKRFTYPKSLYLDQFLAENAELASEKRRVLREMGEEVRVLGLKRGGLVGFKVCRVVWVGGGLSFINLPTLFSLPPFASVSVVITKPSFDSFTLRAKTRSKTSAPRSTTTSTLPRLAKEMWRGKRWWRGWRGSWGRFWRGWRGRLKVGECVFWCWCLRFFGVRGVEESFLLTIPFLNKNSHRRTDRATRP